MASIELDGSSLDGITGAAVQFGGGDRTASSALALGEGRNCIDSPVPFQDYGKPAKLTLGQWQATGRGVSDTIGTCP